MSNSVHIIRLALAEKYGYAFLQAAEKADLDYTTKAIEKERLLNRLAEIDELLEGSSAK